MAITGASRRCRSIPDRRGDRPRRVQRHRRQQRLHEPDGTAQPAGAADVLERRPEVAAGLGVDEEESASWRDAAQAIVVPYDADLGVHPQAEGFLQHDRWDFKATPPERYPLLLDFPYFELYRKQVVKQADLVLAMHLRGDAFTDEQKARNFEYYEGLTVRDSSLSACTQAVLAAEVGHLDLAYDYLAEAALLDLDDLEHNTRDGLHIASLAGAWIGAVAGFGGMRDHDGVLSFMPRLPHALSRLAFRLAFRGRRLLVEIEREASAVHTGRGTAARDRAPRFAGNRRSRRTADARASTSPKARGAVATGGP